MLKTTSHLLARPKNAKYSSTRRRPTVSRLIRTTGQLMQRLMVPAAIIVAWLAATNSRLIKPLFLPGPHDLARAVSELSPQLPTATIASVSMTLTGFIIGTALGGLVGLMTAYSSLFRRLLGDLLDFIRPVPIFALIPLFVLWFGIGRKPQIALIVLGVSVIMGVTTISAVRNVPLVYVKAAVTLGASRTRIYRSVILPAIVPSLLGAVRVGAAASWGLDVAAEFLGAQNGLGYMMINREQYLDTAAIIVIVIMYSCFAYLLDLVVRALERPLWRWTGREAAVSPVASLIGL